MALRFSDRVPSPTAPMLQLGHCCNVVRIAEGHNFLEPYPLCAQKDD